MRCLTWWILDIHELKHPIVCLSVLSPKPQSPVKIGEEKGMGRMKEEKIEYFEHHFVLLPKNTGESAAIKKVEAEKGDNEMESVLKCIH